MDDEWDETDQWDQIGFVISSKYRQAVLEQLVKTPSTPSSIASRTGLHVSHISRALQTVAERSLVELLVSKDTTKGRIYGLTDRGEQLWRRIEAEGMVD